MANDWDEIKKLAADLQSVQLKSTSQKLSDRNCIEIVNYLIKTNRIKLIFTTDGKEYVTLEHLKKEVCTELAASNGRASVSEIARNLTVDPVHVRKSAIELSQSKDNKVYLINDHVIGVAYFVKIANDVNEQLLEKGVVTVNDLIMKWDLPRDIIEKLIIPRLSNIIQDNSDSNVFYTTPYLKRLQTQIRGFLLGATKPVSFDVMATKVASGLQNVKLLFTLIDELKLPGSFDGSTSKSQYVPNIYLQNMTDNVLSFFNQNHYITIENMTRYGVKNPKKFLKTNSLNEPVVFLNSCIVAKKMLDDLSNSFDECLQKNDWYFDLDQFFPFDLTDKDFEIIVKDLLDSNHKRNAVVRIDNYLVTKGLLNKCHEMCLVKVKQNVDKIIESGDYQKQKITTQFADDQDDSTCDKKGKKSKRKPLSNNSSNNVRGPKLKFIDEKEIEEVLQSFLVSKTSDNGQFGNNMRLIVDLLIDNLQNEGSKMAENQFQNQIFNDVPDRRKLMKNAQDQLNTMLTKIRLFEKGLQMCSSTGDLKQQLSKYLLKTSCQQVLDLILNLVMETCNITKTTDGTVEEKLTKIAKVPNKEQIMKISNATNLGDFQNQIKNFCDNFGITIQKSDRKKDRALVRGHRLELIDQLEKCNDVAEVLLLAVLSLFVITTQNIVHASGKHVKLLLEFLVQEARLGSDQHTFFNEYFDMVTKSLKEPATKDDGNDTDNVTEQKMIQMKEFIRNCSKKKSADGQDV